MMINRVFSSCLLFVAVLSGCGDDGSGSATTGEVMAPAKEALGRLLDDAGIEIVDDVDSSPVSSCPLETAPEIASRIVDDYSLAPLSSNVVEQYIWSKAYAGISCGYGGQGEYDSTIRFVVIELGRTSLRDGIDQLGSEDFEQGVISYGTVRGGQYLGYTEDDFEIVVWVPLGTIAGIGDAERTLLTDVARSIPGTVGEGAAPASSAEQTCEELAGASDDYELAALIAGLGEFQNDRVDAVRDECGEILDRVESFAPVTPDATSSGLISVSAEELDCSGGIVTFTARGQSGQTFSIGVAVLADDDPQSHELVEGVTNGAEYRFDSGVRDADSCGVRIEFAIPTD